jgi:hypothetical protein
LGAARRSGHAAGTGLQDLILREYVRPLVGALQTIERYPLGGLRGAELARQLRRHGDEMTDAEVARTELRFLAHCLLVTTHARRSFGARLADAFPQARALRDALAPEPEDG